MENKLYVAVGKEVEERELILKWALDISRGETICVLHVHVPSHIISVPNGLEASVSSIQEEKVKAFQECERKEVVNMLDDCLRMCDRKQVPSEKIYIEKESVPDGIVELIYQLRIQKLVMGAGNDSKYSRKMTQPLSKKANYVLQHAPGFCHIWFPGMDRLIYTREGVKQPNLDVEGIPVKASEHDECSSGISGKELSITERLSEYVGHEGTSDGFDRSSRTSISQSSICSPEAESAFSSPHSSFSREVRESGLELVALPQTKSECQELSQATVLEEYHTIDELYDQLEQSMTEAENSKREAFEESMRRQKAEKEALVAARKVRALQRLYIERLRQKEEKHKTPDERNKELEYTKSQLEKVSQQLHEALDQKLLLEKRLEKTYLSEKEMEEKLLSAVELLQKFKNDRDQLQVEKDHALQEAEELRTQLAHQGQSRSHVPVISEISFSDINKATNYFDPSLVIGEGGKGSTYKGLLHHTEVAIKMLIPNTIHGRQGFEKEAEVLSKLRHPNLVTLIGVCSESLALVYEYLPRGSLEDRLNCKDNTPPLSWQTRIHIARQLCSVLIFLHSSQPTSIIHGCLKPKYILLDDNFACKLHDFGVCSLYTYMDPDLNPKSDIHSFGILLLRLLTGKTAFGIAKEVESALDNDDLCAILDPSAGDWPFVVAEQLARMALRCCDVNPMDRPDLSDIGRNLEAMKASTQPFSSMLLQVCEDQIPHHFICPVFQEMMEDPHIAADGFTYEVEAIRGWLDSDHDTSPMTNVKLANHDLIPNRALRSAIQEWLQHRHKSC